MSALKDYEEKCEECDSLGFDIAKLELYEPIIQKYNDLKSKLEETRKKRDSLKKAAMYDKFNSCNHLWMKTYTETNSYFGCVKCGLDGKVLFFMSRYNDTISEDGKIMYYYLYDIGYDTYYRHGDMSDLNYDYRIACAVCKKILEKHPNIGNQTLLKYLNFAIYKMKTVEVSGDRKISRRKRLFLK